MTERSHFKLEVSRERNKKTKKSEETIFDYRVDAMIVFREDEVDGWWGGEIEGKVGYFPKDFVLSVGDKTNDKIIKVSLI